MGDAVGPLVELPPGVPGGRPGSGRVRRGSGRRPSPRSRRSSNPASCPLSSCTAACSVRDECTDPAGSEPRWLVDATFQADGLRAASRRRSPPHSRCGPGWPSTRRRRADSWPRPATSAPHWPEPWGLDADPIHQLIIDDELRAAGVRRPEQPDRHRLGRARPCSTPAPRSSRRRYLPPLLSGEEIWCQLFSEPGRRQRPGQRSAPGPCATATSGWSTARRSGPRWPSSPRYGILIARTDPDVAKQQGITYFVCPMDTPGHRDPADHRDDRRPHVQRGVPHRRPAARPTTLVGEVNRGWALAKVTLGNERVSLSSGGALWGMGPTGADLLDLVRAAGGVTDPLLRQRLAQLHIEPRRSCGSSACAPSRARIRGEQPGPEASIRKVLADEHGQAIMGLAKDLAGLGRHARRRRSARDPGRDVALRLPVRPGAHHRRRHRRGAAQHPRRAGARACRTTSTSRPA